MPSGLPTLNPQRSPLLRVCEMTEACPACGGVDFLEFNILTEDFMRRVCLSCSPAGKHGVRSLWSHPICQVLMSDPSEILSLTIEEGDGQTPVLSVVRSGEGLETNVVEQYLLTPIASAPRAADADSAAPSPVCPCGGVSFVPCSWLSENFVRMTCFGCGLSGRVNPDSGLLVAVVPHPASVRISEPTRSTDRPAEGLQP